MEAALRDKIIVLSISIETIPIFYLIMFRY